jgi:hypothetical protein
MKPAERFVPIFGRSFFSVDAANSEINGRWRAVPASGCYAWLRLGLRLCYGSLSSILNVYAGRYGVSAPEPQILPTPRPVLRRPTSSARPLPRQLDALTFYRFNDGHLLTTFSFSAPSSVVNPIPKLNGQNLSANGRGLSTYT